MSIFYSTVGYAGRQRPKNFREWNRQRKFKSETPEALIAKK